MRLLLDTHVMLWAMLDDARLTEDARKIIEDSRNDVYFSVVSLCEMSLKRMAHPDRMSVDAAGARAAFLAAGYGELPFGTFHAEAMDTLPLLHRGMLLAQAKAEGMKILSHDNRFPACGDFVTAV
jgi:PIN domain nuclease of toxin-antitoxin system